jgi:hypothetical protein
MRFLPAVALAAILASAPALAQQPGDGSSGLGPGQAPPRSSPLKTTEPPPPATGCDPSFGGKYAGLLRQLPIPEDEGQYGKCHDYGAWNGSEYKGHANLPAGAFWTYSAPNWHVWARRGGTSAAGGCPDPTFAGKYSGELRRISVPQDRGRYGVCNDYGPWSGNAYAGHTNLPNGYWVYSFPQWIIYANRGGQPKN